jgi:hypothetical protein
VHSDRSEATTPGGVAGDLSTMGLRSDREQAGKGRHESAGSPFFKPQRTTPNEQGCDSVRRQEEQKGTE